MLITEQSIQGLQKTGRGKHQVQRRTLRACVYNRKILCLKIRKLDECKCLIPIPTSVLNMGPEKIAAIAMPGLPAIATATILARSFTEFPSARTAY